MQVNARPADRRTRSVRSQLASQRNQTVSPGLDSLIEKLALSPEPDLNALDRVLRYQLRTVQDASKRAFEGSFAKMQMTLPVLAENGEVRDRAGKLQHRYALWEDVNEVIKPILSAYGFALWFRTEDDGQKVVVTAILSHVGGHAEETTLRLPADLTGGKNIVQAIGSAASYGKRYTAAALLNLTSRGEDDDAAATATTELISIEQLDQLRTLMSQRGTDEERLTSYLQIESLPDLPVKRLQRAVDAIIQKGARS